MEDIGVSSESENSVDMFCEHCYELGQQNVTAEGFCVNCVKYFCSQCLEHHSIFLPDHVQQDKNSMPMDFYMEKCNNHPQQLLKFYCKSCKTTACFICKTKLHTQCKEVHHLPRLVAKFDTDKECRILEGSLDHLEKEAADLTGSIDEYRQNIEQQNAKVTKEVKDQKHKVEEIFNNLEEEIDNHYKANKNTLDEADKANDLLKADIQDLKSEVGELKNSHQKCKIYLKTKKLSDQKQQVLKKLRNKTSQLKGDQLRYTYNKAPEKIKPEIFGKLTLESKGVIKGNKIPCFMILFILVCAIIFASPNVAKNMFTKTLSSIEKTFIDPNVHVTLEKLSDINLNSFSLLHSKMTVSPDGKTIYISDMKSVQSYTTEGKLIAEYRNDSLLTPFQITTDTRGNLFVCGVSSKNIFFISSDLKYGYELHVFHTSISYSDFLSYSEIDNTLCIYSFRSKSIKLFKIKRYMKLLELLYIEI